MIKSEFISERTPYFSPECIEVGVLSEGTILSASNLTEKVMGSSAEGYDVDDEVFNW